MKVLWITNVLFPRACEELGIPKPSLGGWMYSGMQSLREVTPELEIAIATPYSGSSLKRFEFDGVTYFLVPRSTSVLDYDTHMERHWKAVKADFPAEVIHIHGTEYPHGLSYLRSQGPKGAVVSIQGLVSVYERYFFGSIGEDTIRKHRTLRDLVRRDSLFDQHRSMLARGEWEKEALRMSRHIIGRTNWDRTHAWAINPTAEYHFCNETLRDSFAQHTWNSELLQRRVIFLSQGHYPIKGMHQAIKALPLILRHHPDAKLKVAGNDFLNRKGLRANGYGSYLASEINRLGLRNKVEFTGMLDENKMVREFLDSSCFLCPSAIENSSNSIGEAQSLGVPCIASYVGGIRDMVEDGVTGLVYRFEEIEMLAESVCRLFDDPSLAQKLSRSGFARARERHDRTTNAHRLTEIYRNICSSLSH
ncbi:MAG: hypothetical protein RL173_486 [Fibrobacterota bacterium]|jgi:glycosyltransferase involved in cell wall biosynthesis